MPMTKVLQWKASGMALASGLALVWGGGYAPPAVAAQPPTYADLADLADQAAIVVRLKIVRQALVEPERAPGLAAGHARLYVVANPKEVLSGTAQLDKVVRYLVDVPVGADGRVASLRRAEVVVFAEAVPGHPGELRLVAPDAQIPADSETVARLMPLLAELAAPGAPASITGIRDILSVRGNLAGESETQLFLDSDGEGPVLVSVVHRPGLAPSWSVSWSELVDQAGRPPAPGTLAWYRLACFLPPRLPPGTNLARDAADRMQAVRDYELVRQELGACTRNR